MKKDAGVLLSGEPYFRGGRNTTVGFLGFVRHPVVQRWRGSRDVTSEMPNVRLGALHGPEPGSLSTTVGVPAKGPPPWTLEGKPISQWAFFAQPSHSRVCISKQMSFVD